MKASGLKRAARHSGSPALTITWSARLIFRRRLKGSYPDEMKLLLAHNPIIFRHAVRYGVDLTLSGHTHGGQVKVRDPEKRIIKRRKLTNGLHSRKDSQIYITRGIGTVVLPVRYQCPPEISLLELRSA